MQEKEAKDRELAAAGDKGKAPASAEPTKDASQKNLPGSKKKFVHQIPLLSEEEICELAKRFADAIPEDELSVRVFDLPLVLADSHIFFQVAGLQGYLLKNKTRPRECVEEVAAWVIQEREIREKLKKEKAEKEEKEKKEREEKEKKEKEEKEKKEKEEKDAKDAKEVCIDVLFVCLSSLTFTT